MVTVTGQGRTVVMSHGFHPTGLFLASHLVFGVFPPASTEAYLEAVRPFSPSEKPRVFVYVVSFDEVSPWPLTPYLEASVFVSVRHGTAEGWYPLMMPVTGRVAMIGGRRRGFPKKIADVSLSERVDEWLGAATRNGRTLLRVRVAAESEIGNEFRDPRTHYFGAPVFNLVPPQRGPKVVATTIETLEEPAATRYGGEMRVEADDSFPWNALLPSEPITGYCERTHGAWVLRHGRVAATHPSVSAVRRDGP
jgi:hypothetical protein